jgi:uncharacterized protein (TIGR02246 family)
MRTTLLLAATAILWAGPVAAQSKSDVQKLDDELAVALNKADAGVVAIFYAEDAILLPPGGPTIQGRGKIQKFWKDTLKSIGNVRLVADNVEALGTRTAQEIGHFSAEMRGKEFQKQTGKYVILWRKVGNDWRIGTDIWNFDK